MKGRQQAQAPKVSFDACDMAAGVMMAVCVCVYVRVREKGKERRRWTLLCMEERLSLCVLI